ARGSGPPTSGRPASARPASTSSLCAITWTRWTGTSRRPARACPKTLLNRRACAIWKPKKDCCPMPDISPRPVAAGTLQSRITGGVRFLKLGLGQYVPNAFDYGLAVQPLLAVRWLAGAGLKQQHRLATLERFFLQAVVVFMEAGYATWAAHGF